MGSTQKLEAQASLIKALEALLGSRIGVVEASRAIHTTCFELRQDNNPLFFPFIAINSETAQFPVGPVRELWAPEALVGYDKERELVEQRHSLFAMQSAKALLGWAQAQEF